MNLSVIIVDKIVIIPGYHTLYTAIFPLSITEVMEDSFDGVELPETVGIGVSYNIIIDSTFN